MTNQIKGASSALGVLGLFFLPLSGYLGFEYLAGQGQNAIVAEVSTLLEPSPQPILIGVFATVALVIALVCALGSRWFSLYAAGFACLAVAFAGVDVRAGVAAGGCCAAVVLAWVAAFVRWGVDSPLKAVGALLAGLVVGLCVGWVLARPVGAALSEEALLASTPAVVREVGLIRSALERYYSRVGNYPKGAMLREALLRELVAKGGLNPQDLRLDRMYLGYQSRDGRSYALRAGLSPAPDGSPRGVLIVSDQ